VTPSRGDTRVKKIVAVVTRRQVKKQRAMTKKVVSFFQEK